MTVSESGMTMKNKIFLLFFVLFNTILLVFVSNMVLQVREDIKALEETMATKVDLAKVKVGELKLFHQEECTRCHTERKFLGPHASSDDLMGAIKRMNTLPDAHLSQHELDKLHASMLVEKCLHCHGKDTLALMALKSEGERMQTVSRMQKKEDSGILPGEVGDISKSFNQLLGF